MASHVRAACALFLVSLAFAPLAAHADRLPNVRAQKADVQGLALYHQDKLADAAAQFYRACMLDGRDPLFQTHLALLLVKQGKYGEMASEFRVIARNAPDTPSPHYWLGRALYQQNMPIAAEPQLRTAAALGSNRWIYHYYLARVLRTNGKLAEAAKERAQADQLRKREPHETA